MKYYLGLDIGGTKTIMRLEDENKKEIGQKRYPSVKEFDVFEKNIREFLSESNVNENDIAAMCCGIPGSVENDGVTVSLIPSLGWQGTVLKDELFSKFPFPCFAINDVNSAMWAVRDEIEEKNAVLIAIGTGVGGAYMCDGVILNGASGFAGEIGYILNETEARDMLKRDSDISHGSFGALESKISGTALEKTAHDSGFVNSTEMFLKYGESPVAAEKVEDFLITLAVCAANCASLTDPEVIMICGGVSNSLPPFMDKLTGYIRRFTPSNASVRITKLGNNAGAVGAVRAAMDYNNNIKNI